MTNPYSDPPAGLDRSKRFKDVGPWYIGPEPSPHEAFDYLNPRVLYDHINPAHPLLDEDEHAFEQSLERAMRAGFKWKTRDGRVMRVAEMEDDHLLNTERFLRGEGATQPGDGITDVRFAWVREHLLDHLRSEIRRRGLTPKPAYGVTA